MPQVPPVNEEPVPVGVQQLNADIFFVTSFEPHEGQVVSSSLVVSFRTEKVSLQLLHVYS
jgi:hypothetical protein